MAKRASPEQHSFRWPDGIRAAVSLSFDDARLSQVDRGLPVLNAHDARATFYVSLASLESRLSGWQEALAQGHEIGNHTLRHPCTGNFSFARGNPLEDYTLERMERELIEASDAIEDLLAVRPSTFAYPCGHTFVGRGENTCSYVPLVARLFRVGRTAFDETHNSPTFCDLAQVTGLDMDCAPLERVMAMVATAVADGGWLVLFGHDVGDGGRQTTLASVLDALCRHARDRANGLWLDTVSAIGDYVAPRASNRIPR